MFYLRMIVAGVYCLGIRAQQLVLKRLNRRKLDKEREQLERGLDLMEWAWRSPSGKGRSTDERIERLYQVYQRWRNEQ